MTDAPRDLTRTHSLTVPKAGDRCDGCGIPLSTGLMAEYRMDGALFHDKACADLHANIPLEVPKGA